MTLRLFCTFFLQNVSVFNIKEKWMELNAISLGLSLDVLIYIIRCSKPKSGD